jgi:hypothetical protein
MNRRDFGRLLSAATVAQTVVAKSSIAQGSGEWSLEADVAECCSCEIPCPCNFGRPTQLRCDGNRLIEITDGQVEGASLAGVRFLVTFEMGKWTRIYIDQSLSAAQIEAYERIMPRAFAGFQRGALSEEVVPMTVQRGPDTLAFSTPASEVEMRQMTGLDGEPIRISGLPSNAFFDYVQYESVRHIHRGGEREWSYSGTNGFVSRMIASG